MILSCSWWCHWVLENIVFWVTQLSSWIITNLPSLLPPSFLFIFLNVGDGFHTFLATGMMLQLEVQEKVENGGKAGRKCRVDPNSVTFKPKSELELCYGKHYKSSIFQGIGISLLNVKPFLPSLSCNSVLRCQIHKLIMLLFIQKVVQLSSVGLTPRTIPIYSSKFQFKWYYMCEYFIIKKEALYKD